MHRTSIIRYWWFLLLLLLLTFNWNFESNASLWFDRARTTVAHEFGYKLVSDSIYTRFAIIWPFKKIYKNPFFPKRFDNFHSPFNKVALPMRMSHKDETQNTLTHSLQATNVERIQIINWFSNPLNLWWRMRILHSLETRDSLGCGS